MKRYSLKIQLKFKVESKNKKSPKINMNIHSKTLVHWTGKRILKMNLKKFERNYLLPD